MEFDRLAAASPGPRRRVAFADLSNSAGRAADRKTPTARAVDAPQPPVAASVGAAALSEFPPWTRCFDPRYECVYWYNDATGVSTWTEPDEPWIDEQPPATEDGDFWSSWFDGASPARSKTPTKTPDPVEPSSADENAAIRREAAARTAEAARSAELRREVRDRIVRSAAAPPAAAPATVAAPPPVVAPPEVESPPVVVAAPPPGKDAATSPGVVDGESRPRSTTRSRGRSQARSRVDEAILASKEALWRDVEALEEGARRRRERIRAKSPSSPQTERPPARAEAAVGPRTAAPEQTATPPSNGLTVRDALLGVLIALLVANLCALYGDVRQTLAETAPPHRDVFLALEIPASAYAYAPAAARGRGVLTMVLAPLRAFLGGLARLFVPRFPVVSSH